jgi:LCP family protein required for cell wall assembly
VSAHRQPTYRAPGERRYAAASSVGQARPVPHARRIRGGGTAASPTRTSTASRSARSMSPIEPRRVLAASLSAVIPGLGQVANGRYALAARLAIPVALVVAIALLVAATTPPLRLAASLIAPSALQALAVASLVLLGWRLVAVLQAFFDGRYARRPTATSAAVLAIVLGLVAVPHAIGHVYIGAAQAAFEDLFSAPTTGAAGASDEASPVVAVGPAPNERLNILLVGIDKTESRTATLTDSMMVVSVDPVGETVSMVSLPRDMVGVPLGNGDVFGPKINALYSWAERHPEVFPEGGIRALQGAAGALLGIPIHYYALIDFAGFVEMIDTVGGVDVEVKSAFYDEHYHDPRLGYVGFGLAEGWHHLDGIEALAYARSRYAPTDTDFTRAGRQQEILVALRARLLKEGGLLFALPDLLRTFGGMVTTDLPTSRLPELAAIAEAMDGDGVTRMVIQKPLVRGGKLAPYGSVQFPDLDAIRDVAAGIFSEPGTPPTSWPPSP